MIDYEEILEKLQKQIDIIEALNNTSDYVKGQMGGLGVAKVIVMQLEANNLVKRQEND